MKRTSLWSFVFVFVFSFAFMGLAEAEDWQVDPAHSSIGFSVKHLGISSVDGNFGKYTYAIKADEKTGKASYFEGTVGIASIDTGIVKRDDHLKAPDFFDAAKFPEAKLITKSIKYEGNEITAVTHLTIKGVTKEVIFKGEFLGPRKADFGQGPTMRAGYSLEGKINRQDFGLKFNKLIEGVSLVGDKIKIKLEVETYVMMKK